MWHYGVFLQWRMNQTGRLFICSAGAGTPGLKYPRQTLTSELCPQPNEEGGAVSDSHNCPIEQTFLFFYVPTLEGLTSFRRLTVFCQTGEWHSFTEVKCSALHSLPFSLETGLLTRFGSWLAGSKPQQSSFIVLRLWEYLAAPSFIIWVVGIQTQILRLICWGISRILQFYYFAAYPACSQHFFSYFLLPFF